MTVTRLYVLALFAGSVLFQLLGVALLPLTKGVTESLPSIAVAVSFLIGIGLMARLSAIGVNLSSLVPLISTVIPLCSVLIGLFVYGETASWARVTTLIVACALIGVASGL
jgi:multidrug transporter EmrE-like cation transporter